MYNMVFCYLNKHDKLQHFTLLLLVTKLIINSIKRSTRVALLKLCQRPSLNPLLVTDGTAVKSTKV